MTARPLSGAHTRERILESIGLGETEEARRIIGNTKSEWLETQIDIWADAIEYAGRELRQRAQIAARAEVAEIHPVLAAVAEVYRVDATKLRALASPRPVSHARSAAVWWLINYGGKTPAEAGAIVNRTESTARYLAKEHHRRMSQSTIRRRMHEVHKILSGN